jgi:hypothetical protein
MRVHKIVCVKHCMLLQEIYFLSAVQYFFFDSIDYKIK